MLAKINNSRVYLVAVFAFIIDFISKLVISNLLIENQSIKVINNFFVIIKILLFLINKNNIKQYILNYYYPKKEEDLYM